MSSTPSDPIGLTQRRIVLIVLIVAIASFIQMLDASILATAIPNMAVSFGVSPVDLGIGITGYIMASLVVIPASSWLASRLGARNVFAAGLVGFTLASLLCGISHTLPQFIGARVLQGLAGAVLNPVGGAITLSAVPRKDRIKMTNLTTAPMLVAPVLGPPIGGLITTYLSWHWIFFLNVPICLAGAILAMRYLPDSRRERRPFDGIGFLLNTAALITLIYGLSEMGGDKLPLWASGGLAALGVGVGVAAVRHARRAAHPLVPLDALKYPTFTLISLWGMGFLRLPITALPFIVPIMLQVGFGMTAALSGTVFLAHAVGDLATKGVVTRVLRRFGYRAVMLACTWGLAVAVAACALLTRQPPLVVVALMLAICGVFRSFLNTGFGTLSYADLPVETIPSATTFNQVVMQVAQAVGVSITVVVMQSSTLLRRRPLGAVDAWDCRVALCLAAVVALMALFPFHKLARDAGSELSGHRP